MLTPLQEFAFVLLASASPAQPDTTATKGNRRHPPTRLLGRLLGLLLAAGVQLAAASHAAAAPLPDSAVPTDAGAPSSQGPPAASSADGIAALEAGLVEQVNADRAANGLAPLAFHAVLVPIARQRAADQVPLRELSHYLATGEVAIAPLLAAAQLNYQLAGENLVRLPGPDGTTVERAEVALMSSPKHRENILEPRFDHVATGAAITGDGRVVLVQLFLAPR